jgi:DNA-binding response OmpR family regulator
LIPNVDSKSMALHDRVASKGSPVPDADISMLPGKKVLVVSRDNYFLGVVGGQLIKNSFTVTRTKAKDDDLIKMLTELEPDLTILDTPLIAMEGIRQLLGIRETTNAPILMLSTEGAKADTVRTLSVGSANRAFIKPITFEQLLSQINRIMAKR